MTDLRMTLFGGAVAIWFTLAIVAVSGGEEPFEGNADVALALLMYTAIPVTWLVCVRFPRSRTFAPETYELAEQTESPVPLTVLDRVAAAVGTAVILALVLGLFWWSTEQAFSEYGGIETWSLFGFAMWIGVWGTAILVALFGGFLTILDGRQERGWRRHRAVANKSERV